jgi:hypothetical protein
MIEHAAMACACRRLGYGAIGDRIVASHLDAEAVARLFRLSARRDRGHIAAIVVLSGSIARHAIDPSTARTGAI